MAVTYRPGTTVGEAGWLLVVAGRAALLYRAADGRSAQELLAALVAPDAVQAALDILTRHGLTSTPEFAMAAWTGAASTDAVLLVRGSATASARTASATGDGEVRLDGTTVSTWQERRVTGVTSIELGDTVAPGTGFPLVRGVVPAEGALLSRDPAATGDEDATREPATEPVGAAAAPVAPAAPVGPPAPAAPSAPVAAPAAAESSSPVEPGPAPTAIIEATITELAEPEAPVEPGAPVTEPTGYAHLFEETIVRSIEDAAVRPPSEDDDAAAGEATTVSADAASDAPPAAGDHDGMTIMSGDIAKLRGRAGRAGSPDAAPPAAPPAPPRFVLAVSNGTSEIVTGTVLVGRSPSVSKVSSGQVPRLVSITGDQDISRNHAQFALEGDTVVVTDLHSRNGTSIVLPGHAPQILRPGEPTPIISGTVVDLGGGTTMTLRDESASERQGGDS